ncbi:hypothetical protein CRENBAI_011958 [Crenichthys baileyi]|uniref:Uncharacterized protein n=1 Tax=Crenichthys baileyi TaxID=28760 RepID=A0AAV9SEQ9_9TELE
MRVSTWRRVKLPKEAQLQVEVTNVITDRPLLVIPAEQPQQLQQLWGTTHIPTHERGFGVCRALAIEDLAADLTAPGWIPCSKDRQGCWLPCGPRAETAQRRASFIMAASATHKPGKRQITHISTESADGGLAKHELG